MHVLACGLNAPELLFAALVYLSSSTRVSNKIAASTHPRVIVCVCARARCLFAHITAATQPHATRHTPERCPLVSRRALGPGPVHLYSIALACSRRRLRRHGIGKMFALNACTAGVIHSLRSGLGRSMRFPIFRSTFRAQNLHAHIPKPVLTLIRLLRVKHTRDVVSARGHCCRLQKHKKSPNMLCIQLLWGASETHASNDECYAPSVRS